MTRACTELALRAVGLKKETKYACRGMLRPKHPPLTNGACSGTAARQQHCERPHGSVAATATYVKSFAHAVASAQPAMLSSCGEHRRRLTSTYACTYTTRPRKTVAANIKRHVRKCSVDVCGALLLDNIAYGSPSPQPGQPMPALNREFPNGACLHHHNKVEHPVQVRRDCTHGTIPFGYLPALLSAEIGCHADGVMVVAQLRW